MNEYIGKKVLIRANGAGVYTMCRFMELTANAYGGEAIRQLAKAYNFKIK